jgi:hypothetical protein
MSGTLQSIQSFFMDLYAIYGDGLLLLAGVLAFIGIVAQWKLYDKANQPGIASIVPIWNFIVFLRIVGRPASHMFLFFIPIYGQFYLIPKVYIELCNSFGKNSIVDYVLVILFNGFYILNLGLSYETEYLGPSYGKDPKELLASQKAKSALA